MEFKEILDEKSAGVAKSPTAFPGVPGVTNLGVGGLSLCYRTDESLEGVNAFTEKRKPDFGSLRKGLDGAE